MTVIEIIDQISNTPGSKDKMTILEQNMSPLLKQIFNDTYDTSRNYYIKKFIEPSGAGKMTIEDNYQVFHNMLDALNKRVVIGNAAIEFVSNTIALYITIPRTGVRGRVTRMPHYCLLAKCDFISAISSAIDFAIDTKISHIFFIKFFVFSDNFLILTK